MSGLRVCKRDQSKAGEQYDCRRRPTIRLLEFRDHADPLFQLVSFFQDSGQARRPSRAAKAYQQFDDGAAVRPVVFFLCIPERQCVARQFPVHPHAVKGQPHQRIEPVQNLQGRHQPTGEDVTPLDMTQFMQEHVTQVFQGKTPRQSHWQHQTRSHKTKNGWTANHPGLDQRHRRADAHQLFAILQQIHHRSVDQRTAPSDSSVDSAVGDRQINRERERSRRPRQRQPGDAQAEPVRGGHGRARCLPFALTVRDGGCRTHYQRTWSLWSCPHAGDWRGEIWETQKVK